LYFLSFICYLGDCVNNLRKTKKAIQINNKLSCDQTLLPLFFFFFWLAPADMPFPPAFATASAFNFFLACFAAALLGCLLSCCCLASAAVTGSSSTVWWSSAKLRFKSLSPAKLVPISSRRAVAEVRAKSRKRRNRGAHRPEAARALWCKRTKNTADLGGGGGQRGKRGIERKQLKITDVRE